MNVPIFAIRLQRLRQRLNLGVPAFYARYGISKKVGQSWERGVWDKPDEARRILVMLIEESPDTIAEIYRKAVEKSKLRRPFDDDQGEAPCV